VRSDEKKPKTSINAGYVADQLVRALRTAETHADPAARLRAEARADRFRKVLGQLLDGNSAIGTRTPIAGLPAWVTLEVVKGGFATGAPLAGGPLEKHEVAQLEQLGLDREAGRGALNAYHLSDEGRAALRDLMRSGCYRIHLPEQGALLAFAWLVEHGETTRAGELLDAIAAFLERLQLAPVPDPKPRAPSAVVRLQTVAQTLPGLTSVEVPEQVALMNEAFEVWGPMSDRAVALFLDTLEGAPPQFVDGKITGGWPCRHYPDGWSARAQALLDEYRRTRELYPSGKKVERPRENFPRLRGYLERCLRDPKSLAGRDVGMIRCILAGVNARRGLPGSAELASVRAEQAAHAARPTVKRFAEVIVDRLRQKPSDEGLSTIDDVIAPLTVEDAAARAMPTAAGVDLPPQLTRKVLRCWEAPIDELVGKRVITSSETLARVLPQITAQVAAAGIADPELRALHAAVYAAFRQRRSLLLIDLSSQVRLEELPWVAAIQPYLRANLDDRTRARQVLEQLVILALTSFPAVILPNKLLQEIRALCKAAALDLPIVDELAADIFMGTLTAKFLQAAQLAAPLVEGTLYARYYGLDYRDLVRIDAGAKTAGDEFAKRCIALAGSPRVHSSVAANGTIVEHEQILTTHNLATLFGALDLARKLPLAELSRNCFTFICRAHQRGVADWHAQLTTLKSSAYAWRQMLFFLSQAPADEAPRFVAWAKEHFGQQDGEFRTRFAPVVAGLAHVVAGGGFDKYGRAVTFHGAARRFLGWTVERHWLLPPSPDARH
jgi:hypothetical protein